jgi:hypothetical protein
MADETVCSAVVAPVFLDDSGENSGIACEYCERLKLVLKEPSSELSSTKERIKLLQEEIIWKEETVVNKKLKDPSKSDKVVYSKCNCDTNGYEVLEGNQHHIGLVVTKDLQNLHSVMLQLVLLLKSADETLVREVILPEIKMVTSKISSLKELVVENSGRESKWTEVVNREKNYYVFLVKQKDFKFQL